MNKVIDDKQCTILWHVYDLKTSNVNPAVVSSVLDDIDAEYGKNSKMTITRGKAHKYLGTTIDYYSTGKVIFLMIDYIGKMLGNILENTRGESATPASHHHLENFRICNQTIPCQRRPLPLFCSTTNISFK